MQRERQNTILLSQNHFNILKIIFQQNYLQDTIAMHFPELLPPKSAKYGPQIEFTTKHRRFGFKVYLISGNFTRLLLMVVTFCMSASDTRLPTLSPPPPGKLHIAAHSSLQTGHSTELIRANQSLFLQRTLILHDLNHWLSFGFKHIHTLPVCALVNVYSAPRIQHTS